MANATSAAVGMLMVKMFVVTLIVNAIVISVANMVFPMQVVLGTMSLSRPWALILSSGMIALVTTFAWPFVVDMEVRRQKDWTPLQMIVIYFVVNFLSIWLIARVSEVFGLGISSWMAALLLAVPLDFIQGAAMMGLEKMKK